MVIQANAAVSSPAESTKPCCTGLARFLGPFVVRMPRIDIWDVEAAKKAPAVDCGFPRDLETHFEWGRVLGKGGFGLVR